MSLKAFDSRQAYLTLFLVWLSYIGLYLNRRNISIVLPVLIREVKISYSEAGFLVSAFFVTYALAQIPSGWLADRLGGLKTLVTGNIITFFSSMMSGLAVNYPMLLLSRVFCGLGQGMGWPSSTKLVSQSFPEERRGFALGALTSSVAVGSFTSLTVSAAILEWFDWRMVFLIPSIILLFFTLLLFLGLRRFYFNMGDIGSVGVGFGRVFRDRVVFSSALSYFCWKFGFEGLSYWLPTFFFEVKGFSLQNAGLIVGVFLLIGMFAMPIGGVLSDRLNRVFIIELSLILAGFLLFIFTISEGVISLIILMFVSFFFQMSEGIYFTIPADRLKSDLAGTGAGFINSLGQVGSFSSPLITGIVIELYHSYTIAFLLYSLLSLLGFSIIWLAKHLQ